jgi:hypothetical protein
MLKYSPQDRILISAAPPRHRDAECILTTRSARGDRSPTFTAQWINAHGGGPQRHRMRFWQNELTDVDAPIPCFGE